MNAATRIAAPVIRPAAPGEAAAIDAFVRANADGTPFHLPRWTDAVARGTGQRAHMLVAVDGGRIAGVLPLTEMRHLLFGKAMVSTGFAVGGGALGDDPAICAALADAAWSLAAQRGVTSVELRGGMLPGGGGWVTKEGAHAGFVRPLAADDAAELKAVPRKQRAEVRKAIDMGFAIEVGSDAAAARAHYAVYAESVRNLGTPVFPRRLFDAVRAAFGTDANILTVRHDGVAVASVLSLYFGGTVYPYWGGGTFAARRLRANEAMYFALMRHARERGCTAFNFGRSKVGSGAFAYKKNWGFEPAPLAYAVRTGAGAEGREVSPNDPRYSAKIELWKKLPLWLANRLGPPLARGLG